MANFAIYRRKVVNALNSMDDYYRYYPTMIHWVGFRLTKFEIEHAERTDGIKSSYNFKKRLSLAFDTIISFSDKPLRLTVKLGILISILTALGRCGSCCSIFHGGGGRFPVGPASSYPFGFYRTHHYNSRDGRHFMSAGFLKV